MQIRGRSKDGCIRGDAGPECPTAEVSSGVGGTVWDMTLMWEEVVVDIRDPKVLGLWWRDALGWVVVGQSDDEVEIAPTEGAHPTLLFGVVPEGKTVKNRLHLDFVPDDQAAEVDRLLAMGATRADVGQDDVPWVVLADPEGNEFCVLAARR
jgi:hypothetical protein